MNRFRVLKVNKGATSYLYLLYDKSQITMINLFLSITYYS